VVLDRFIPSVKIAPLEKFLAVLAYEVAPTDRTPPKSAQQSFARAEIGHPDIVTIHRQTSAAKTSGKNT
jgi:hypothetical protein